VDDDKSTNSDESGCKDLGTIIPNCKEEANQYYCKICDGGYILMPNRQGCLDLDIDTNCAETELEKLLIVNNEYECPRCVDGFYLNQAYECNPCSSIFAGCGECSSSGECTNCASPDQYLSNSKDRCIDYI